MYPLILQLLIFLLSLIVVPHVISEGTTGDLQKVKDAARFINEKRYAESEDILLPLTKHPSLHGEVSFLLGRLYKEKGDPERAEGFLKKAIEDIPILRDYALFMLADLYKSQREFSKAIKTVKMIKSPLLLQDARRLEFNALIAMEDEDEAIRVLSRYLDDYKSDLNARFLLATLYKKHRINDQAIELLKDVYISASGPSDDALKMLRELKADLFTEKELMKRAENLFNNYNYNGAKETYKRLLEVVRGETKEKILFEIGMCEFRLKHYKDAAKTFEGIKEDRALYWQAVALFRIDDIEGFNMIIKRFEREYPHNLYLARLILMRANAMRREGRLEDARSEYEKVLKGFPQMREDALWGLGWLYYSMGNYKKALEYLTILKNGYSDYKYLYWWLRTCERSSDKCIEDDLVDDKLLKDDSYYGHLIRLRYYKKDASGGRHHGDRARRPDGVVYKRVDTLVLLGMKEWAIREIRHLLDRAVDENEILFLSHLAEELNEYKTIIAFAEHNKGAAPLTLLYPLGYWEIIRETARENGIDPYLVTAVIREESRFDPRAMSWAGAVGLMQLIPITAKRFSPYDDRDSLYDAVRNITIGTRYLSNLINEFKELPYAIAAYNAGEHTIKKWLERMKGKEMDEFIEDIPYTETRGYVMKVLKSYWRYKGIYGVSS